MATDEKSNEIKAIPALLEMLKMEGAVITIDAMGCQKDIAKTIVKKKGHYVLQVKKNQPGLHDRIKETFDELTGRGIPCVPYAFHEEVDGGHGRVETRRIGTTDWTDWYPERKQWDKLLSFACVESERTVGDRTSTERSYYISDLDDRDARAILRYIRCYWGVENKLHWSLDMSFREDGRRNRIGYAAENLSRISRLTLNLLRNEKSYKGTIPSKRYKACLQQDYLLKVLGAANKIR